MSRIAGNGRLNGPGNGEVRVKIGVTCYPTYGGSGVLATELGKLVAKHGCEVHFITSRLPSRLKSSYQTGIYFHEVTPIPYPLFENNTPYALALASKMKEVFTNHNLDLIHVHYALPHAISAYLASKMITEKKLPFVTTLHGTDITVVGKDRGYYDITRLGINESTVVTSVSQYLRQETEKIFEPTVPVDTIYNFVDLELFKPFPENPVRNYFAKPNQPVYLHVSNFRKVKRIPDVIEIFYRIRQSLDAILLLVGEGPMLGEAHEMVRSMGLESSVKFLGQQEDVVTMIQIADVLLFPSQYESFGLAPLEAMACEVPVISTLSGGIPEVVVQGENGFLSEVGNVEEMAQNAIRLGESPELRKKMGQSGRKRAMTFFNPKDIVNKYMDVYEKAIAKAKDAS